MLVFLKFLLFLILVLFCLLYTMKKVLISKYMKAFTGEKMKVPWRSSRVDTE